MSSASSSKPSISWEELPPGQLSNRIIEEAFESIGLEYPHSFETTMQYMRSRLFTRITKFEYIWFACEESLDQYLADANAPRLIFFDNTAKSRYEWQSDAAKRHYDKVTREKVEVSTKFDADEKKVILEMFDAAEGTKDGKVFNWLLKYQFQLRASSLNRLRRLKHVKASNQTPEAVVGTQSANPIDLTKDQTRSEPISVTDRIVIPIEDERVNTEDEIALAISIVRKTLINYILDD